LASRKLALFMVGTFLSAALVVVVMQDDGGYRSSLASKKFLAAAVVFFVCKPNIVPTHNHILYHHISTVPNDTLYNNKNYSVHILSLAHLLPVQVHERLCL